MTELQKSNYAFYASECREAVADYREQAATQPFLSNHRGRSRD